MSEQQSWAKKHDEEWGNEMIPLDRQRSIWQCVIHNKPLDNQQQNDLCMILAAYQSQYQ